MLRIDFSCNATFVLLVEYFHLTCDETLMSFGTLMVSLLLVWLSMEFVKPSLEEELCPLVNWFWFFGVVMASLLAATTAVVVESNPPPPWSLFTVGLLFKFSVAVKDVTYMGEFLMKPFNSSFDVVVWFSCNEENNIKTWCSLFNTGYSWTIFFCNKNGTDLKKYPEKYELCFTDRNSEKSISHIYKSQYSFLL